MRNTYRTAGEITYITIPSKKYGPLETVIDTKNIQLVSTYNMWYILAPKSNKTWYAIYQPLPEKRNYEKAILMHRLILGNPEGMWIDHWDHNGLNNLESNIFVVTRRQNFHNRTDQKKYIGVRQWANRFYGEIGIGKHKYQIPMVDTERQASYCYNMVCEALGDTSMYEIHLTVAEKHNLLGHLRVALKLKRRNAISTWIIRGLIIYLTRNNFHEFVQYIRYAESLALRV